MDDLEQKLFHRVFQLECDRDRLRDDLAASELIAARYAAALARLQQWECYVPLLRTETAKRVAEIARHALTEGA